MAVFSTVPACVTSHDSLTFGTDGFGDLRQGLRRAPKRIDEWLESYRRFWEQRFTRLLDYLSTLPKKQSGFDPRSDNEEDS